MGWKKGHTSRFSRLSTGSKNALVPKHFGGRLRASPEVLPVFCFAYYPLLLFGGFLYCLLRGCLFCGFFRCHIFYSPCSICTSNLQHQCCSYRMYRVMRNVCQEKNAKFLLSRLSFGVVEQIVRKKIPKKITKVGAWIAKLPVRFLQSRHEKHVPSCRCARLLS
jgi:hypothetical protein